MFCFLRSLLLLLLFVFLLLSGPSQWRLWLGMADSVDAAAAADGSVLVLGPSDLLFWVTFVAFVVVAVKRAWKCATSTSSSSK